MNWKKPTLIALWSLVALAWLGVVGIYFTDPSKALWVGTVAGAWPPRLLRARLPPPLPTIVKPPSCVAHTPSTILQRVSNSVAC